MKIKQYETFYSHSKAEIIVNEGDIDGIFESIYTKVISSIQNSLRKGSDWIINSATEHSLIFQSTIL